MDSATLGNMRRVTAVLSLIAAGCGYPQFEFGPADAADETFEPIDSATDLDTSAADTTIDDTAMADSAADVTKDTAPEKTGCAAITADFCADFDSVSTPGTNWTGTDIQGASSVAFDSTSRSAPKSFLATTASGTLATAFLYKNFTAPTNTTPMRAEAWFMLDAATFPTTTGGSAFLLKIERNGGAGDGVTFSIGSSGFFADRIGSSYERWPITYKLDTGTWIHVRMDVVLHTTAGSLTIWLDDMTTPVLSKVGISNVQADSTARAFDVGVFSDHASAPFKARFDDVSFSFR